MSVLTRNNVRMRGTGDRAMVFAHGFGCDQATWRHIAPRFEMEFLTVSFDHVGSGGSDLSAYQPEKYGDLQAYARDLIELGRELHWEDAIVVGHSCSAMIGALASIDAPRMFERMVLIGASPRYINDGGYVGGFSQAEIDHILVALRADYSLWAASFVPIFMGNPDRPALATELLQSFQRSDPAITAEFGRTIFTSDVRSELKRVTAEVLIIQSASDPVVPDQVGQYICGQIPNSTLKVLLAEGHFPHLSAPEQIIEAIRQFISTKLEPRAARSHDKAALPPLPALSRRPARWSKDIPVRQISDAESRAALEDLLLRRAGELVAQLGRFDMHALAILRLLQRGSAAPADESSLTLRSRGAVIVQLLGKMQLASSISAEFSAVHAVLDDVLKRHKIAARNGATVPRLLNAPSATRRAEASPRDWYDFAAASDQELMFFVDLMERDILKIASLYLRLAKCALEIQRALISH